MADDKQRRIAIVGAGHVGLITAVGLSSLGHKVVALDKNADLIRGLEQGIVPFLEPGLQELVAREIAENSLSFTTSYQRALDSVEFVFLCVNTPSTVSGAADLSFVRDAAVQIGAEIRRQKIHPIIVNKSTSPIGTGETIDVILRGLLDGVTEQPCVVSNPEFLREGSAVEDFFHPDRIVVGCERREAAEAVAALYAGINAPSIVTDLRSAELIKYVSNAFLATRVSFINEIARLCYSIGVDIDLVAKGAGMDPRIGERFFSAGIGFGGSCLPKDVAALLYTGDLVGAPTRLLSAVQDVNLAQRRFVVQRVKARLGSLEACTIGVWGLTFKGGSEDLRESPALDIVHLLRNEGAKVRAYDPSMGEETSFRGVDELCVDPLSAAEDADALMVLTDWPAFANVDFSRVREQMRGDFVYDGRNVLNRSRVEAGGLIYEGMGRPSRSFSPPLVGASEALV